jgi:hypothetical protein
VLTDDVLGMKTLDPFGPGVPRENQAIGIKHEDGVVADARNEQLEALFTSILTLRLPPGAYVVHAAPWKWQP